MRGEEESLPVARILIACLNSDDADWGAHEQVGQPREREEGVDCVARSRSDSSKVLRMQVTKSDGSASVWRDLGRRGETAVEIGNAEATDRLRSSIERKQLLAGPDLVLALNAVEAVGLVFAPVLDAFDERHGAWARSLGFQAIWIVGPSADRTHRLA